MGEGGDWLGGEGRQEQREQGGVREKEDGGEGALRLG
jgi:hypothetical protein